MNTYLAYLVHYGCLYDLELLRQLPVDELSPLACGLLSRSLPTTPAMLPVRQKLAAKLQSIAGGQFVQQASLLEICAVIDGLQALDRQLITSDMPVALVQRLLAAEQAVGGPYAELGRQPDLLTNAYIAQCLSWLAQPMPGLEQYLIARQPELSEYARTDWPLLIALADNYDSYQDGHDGHDGSLPATAIIAALAGQILWQDGAGIQPGPAGRELPAENIYRASQQLLRDLSGPLLQTTDRMLQQVITSDYQGMRQEVSQLAWRYASAFDRSSDKSPSRPNLAQLEDKRRRFCQAAGVANIYAWIAYSIYDDFLDDEGQPAMLGTANYSFRAMLGCYRQLVPSAAGFDAFVNHCLTLVDHANSLETSDFRWASNGRRLHLSHLPDFGDCDLLADRALFHILGPMAVLAREDVAVGSAAWESVLRGWRHYLIARQLNDDLHDWRDDLQAGHATYVTVELLRYLNVPFGNHQLSKLMPIAQEQFWQAVLPRICQAGLQHADAARQAFAAGPRLRRDNQIDGMLDYISGALQAAENQRQQASRLLDTMRCAYR